MDGAGHCLALRLLLLWLLLTPLLLDVQAGTSTKWYGVQVSVSTLTGLLRETVSGSVLQCATQASIDPQVNLFCYQVGLNCQLYTMVVSSQQGDPATLPATDCWTKHDDECLIEGEVHQASGTCEVTYCQGGKVVPYTGSSASNVNFSELVTNGCLYLEEDLLNFDTARSRCQNLGGDLFVAGDFEGLQDYLGNYIPLADVWVGGRSRKWLDGHDVLSIEWAENVVNNSPDPNGPLDDCVRMGVSDDDSLHWMMDKGCSQTFASLCHIGVSYP